MSTILSVSVTDVGLVFERDGMRAALPNEQLDERGLDEFRKLNYELQGTVGYQHFVDGVMAGISLLMGPPNLMELQTIEPSEVGTVEGVLLDPGPLAGEEIIVPGHTVHDGVIAGTSDIAAATEVTAAEGATHGGLTPSRSPEAPAAS
jgi:hypothetical protein